ncbi:MAG TPA: hypothetical protein VLE47_01800 [Candidatus Saccharimonadales bacterium]|nr:hypothetical protein [Candidatus Saccharimonadales bacterium]
MGKVISDLSHKFGGIKVHTLVGHTRPDLDVLLGFYLAECFGLCTPDVRYEFVRSGETLAGSAANPRILHIDTGRGEYDTHGKALGETCSAELLAKKLGVNTLPGIAELLAWVNEFDAGRQADFPPTDLFHHVKRIPNRNTVDGVTNWEKVVEQTYECFDSVRESAKSAHLNQQAFPDTTGFHVTADGLVVWMLGKQPYLKDAAFKAGVDVVVWTQPVNSHYYVGIAVNALRKCASEVDLERRNISLRAVVELLRLAEANGRGLRVSDADLVGYDSAKVPGWFLHDSERLVLCGSGTHPLDKDECTKLSAEQIFKIVLIGLGEKV